MVCMFLKCRGFCQGDGNRPNLPGKHATLGLSISGQWNVVGPTGSAGGKWAGEIHSTGRAPVFHKRQQPQLRQLRRYLLGQQGHQGRTCKICGIQALPIFWHPIIVVVHLWGIFNINPMQTLPSNFCRIVDNLRVVVGQACHDRKGGQICLAEPEQHKKGMGECKYFAAFGKKSGMQNTNHNDSGLPNERLP